MARPVWTGSISFGLVSVPVKAYTAARDHTVHFNQLERETGARVRHQNVSEQTGDEVERDDIVLGYEVSGGRYVTFERDELDELRPTSTRAIDVQDFVALADVDPIYYQKTYWLGPDGDAAAEPYALLLAAMEDRERVAIGSVVMRNKQYLAAVRPLDGALAMSTMRFADEVVDRATIDEIPDKADEADPKALKLAVQIVDTLTGDWDPEQYHDTFVEELRRIIEAKAEGETIEVEQGDEGGGAKVLDLMEALKASLDASRGDGKAAAPAEKAASKPAAAKEKAPAKKEPAAKKAPAKRAAAKTTTAKKAPAKKKPAAKKKAPAKKQQARKTA
ncbi:MAG: Ku protein [Ilumatobacteraceae bacterium]|nr:Ku protein [Ilumatobacteraceae bacterium]